MSEAGLAAGTPARPEGAAPVAGATARARRAARTDHVPRTTGWPLRWSESLGRPFRWSESLGRSFRRHDLVALGRFVGFAATAVTLVLFALLHVLMARLSPLTHTLSDYALSPDRGIFNAAVLSLAAGSVLLLVPLWRGRHAPPRSQDPRPRGPGLRQRRRDVVAPIAALSFACWFVGLVVLTVFRRDPAGVPVTVTGQIHQWASVVALLGLPLGALLTARRHRAVGAGPVSALAAVCLASLVPFVTAYVAGSPLRPYLGLLERVVALVEIALLLVLGTASLIARVPAPRTAGG
jgi:uncharacterized membrane protein (DUF485 family)